MPSSQSTDSQPTGKFVDDISLTRAFFPRPNRASSAMQNRAASKSQRELHTPNR